MSTHRLHIPTPDQIDYHQDLEQERVRRAMAVIDPGDLLAIVRDRLAAEANPQADPLYPMILFYLDRQTAVDGAKLYNDCRALVLAAISTALDDALEAMED